jgi:hypothetical protein
VFDVSSNVWSVSADEYCTTARGLRDGMLPSVVSNGTSSKIRVLVTVTLPLEPYRKQDQDVTRLHRKICFLARGR